MTGVPKLSKSEKRFREGRGKQYQRDGITVRCQSVSKTNLRRIRIERGDINLSSDDVWPEGQCIHSAVPGTYNCNLHGGESLTLRGNNPISSVLPYDLREKIQILQQNPDYINREFQIWEVLGMNSQLYEKMAELGGGPDSFEKILDGLTMIEKGNIVGGTEGIREVVLSEKAQRELRDEIRTNMNLLKELTKVQVSTAKELKTMATTDQVMAMAEGIVDDFIKVVKDVVTDKTMTDQLIDRFVRSVKLRLNARVPVTQEMSDGSSN